MESKSNPPAEFCPSFIFSYLPSNSGTDTYEHPLPSMHFHHEGKCRPELQITSGCLVYGNDAFYFLDSEAPLPAESSTKPQQKRQEERQSRSCTQVGEVVYRVKDQNYDYRLKYHWVSPSVRKFDSIYVRLNTPSITATTTVTTTQTIPEYYFSSIEDAATSFHDLVVHAILESKKRESDNHGFAFNYNFDGNGGDGDEQLLLGEYQNTVTRFADEPDVVLETKHRFPMRPKVKGASSTKDEEYIDGQIPPKSWVITKAASGIHEPPIYPWFKAVGMLDDALGHGWTMLPFHSTQQLCQIILEGL